MILESDLQGVSQGTWPGRGRGRRLRVTGGCCLANSGNKHPQQADFFPANRYIAAGGTDSKCCTQHRLVHLQCSANIDRAQKCKIVANCNIYFSSPQRQTDAHKSSSRFFCEIQNFKSQMGICRGKEPLAFASFAAQNLQQFCWVRGTYLW